MATEILVNLNKKRDFYNKFNNHKINERLSEYIYNESMEGSYKDNIVINIDCNVDISDKEKQEMIDIIRRNYGVMVQDLLYSYEKEQNKKAILLAIGIALIILYYTNFASILREIILMSGWVSICGSIYSLIFSSTQSYVKINRLKNLSKARIYFNK